MPQKYTAIIFHFLLILCSCDMQPKANNGNTNMYFDMHTVVMQQKMYLTQHHIAVEKYSKLNDNTSHNLINNPDWNTEMLFFDKIDINKPIYKDSYKAFAYENDTFVVNYYSHRKGDKLPVTYIKNYFTHSNKLYKSMAMLTMNNYIFSTNKYLEMIFDTSAGELKMIKYKIKGESGFIFMPKDVFEIAGTPLYR
ncbi:MAG: hypothetical protein NW207_10405 [Cytophagales bacterium]|nr:hypothetical protein [Cytophagales bacterium]